MFEVSRCELANVTQLKPCEGPLHKYFYAPNRNWRDTVRCIRHGNMLIKGWQREG